MLYNNPGRVGYTLTTPLVDELAHQMPNIVGMKDTSRDITLTEEFIRRTRDVGVPYRPSLPTPAGGARDGFVRTMTAAGLL